MGEEDTVPETPDVAVAMPDLRVFYINRLVGESAFRNGGKQLASSVELPQTTSYNDNWMPENEERQDRPRHERWRAHSDSAIRPAEAVITGKVPLPLSQRVYRAVIRRAAEFFHLFQRGGMQSRNWLRMEMKSEERKDEQPERENLTGIPVEDSLPGTSSIPSVGGCRPGGGGSRRRGARDVTRDQAGEMKNRILLTQGKYDAKMTYAKVSHKLDILMSSVSRGAQLGYKISWKHWIMFRKGQEIPMWLDRREDGRGECLVNFILSEHDVLGLKPDTIRSKISGIRFPHIISGKNDFTTA